MFKRTVTSVLERYTQIFPIIGIIGPRQSGKTTLAKTYFSHLPYVSLENLDTRERALTDPRAFLNEYKDGAIFDEIQNTPELLSYLQEVVDEDPRKGRYIITGSQNFSLNQFITQSLAGRVGMITLLPLSLEELNFPSPLPIFKGEYPGPHQLNIQSFEFYPNYIQTYIERDVRQLKNIENLGTFQKFLKLCAGRIGQVINFTSLSQDCGISHTTAKQWLNILEASYLIFFLQPFYKNFSKRLVKMPKLYFCDTGLACFLLGLEKEEQLETHYLKGALFENLVMLEILKGRLNRGLSTNLYFWRDQTGHEVDVIGEWGGYIHAIEIKSGSTLQKEYLKNIKYFLNLAKQNSKGYLIYQGNQEGLYTEVTLLPIQKITKLF